MPRYRPQHESGQQLDDQRKPFASPARKMFLNHAPCRRPADAFSRLPDIAPPGRRPRRLSQPVLPASAWAWACQAWVAYQALGAGSLGTRAEVVLGGSLASLAACRAKQKKGQLSPLNSQRDRRTHGIGIPGAGGNGGGPPMNPGGGANGGAPGAPGIMGGRPGVGVGVKPLGGDTTVGGAA